MAIFPFFLVVFIFLIYFTFDWTKTKIVTRSSGDENATGFATNLVADARAEVVHFDGGVRLYWRRFRHVRSSSRGRSIHASGFVCSRMPTETRTIVARGYRAAKQNQEDWNIRRPRIRRTDDSDRAEPVGSGRDSAIA